MAQFPNAMSNKIELVKYRHLCGYEAEILRFVEADVLSERLRLSRLRGNRNGD